MKKGQELRGIVERVEFPDKGIVLVTQDEVIDKELQKEEHCVVKSVLPGQEITFRVTKVKKGKGEGRMLSLEEKSPLEVESPCEHFGICGGCTYLSLPYEVQLKLKEEQVKKLLDSVLYKQKDVLEYQFEGIKGSPKPYEYRNKMEFSFGDESKDGPLSLGMHKRGSFYDIVTVSDCKIVDQDYRMILTETLAYFSERNTTFFHRLSHQGYLRHLLVRKAAKTGEILIALITTTQESLDLEGYKEMLMALPLQGTIVGVIHTKNDSVADVVKSDSNEILFGRDYFYEELLGLKFQISQFSFFQTNSAGAEVLYQTARDYIGRLDDSDSECDKIVYDLYSGTGTIAQLLAPVAKKVIGVEIVEEAVERAIQNAEGNSLTNCEFIAGDVLAVLDQIEEKPDFIVLDPPRDGIHPKALQKIIDYGVERLVYISCKPTSLIRDLEVFLAQGYVVEKAVAVDQFPWTANVETVVLLSQQKPSDRIAVDLDLDELDVTSAETKATYAEIKDYVLKEHGLKVSNLYISQVKRKCGLEVVENFNLAKSEGARGPVDLCSARTEAIAKTAKQPNCPEEKEKAIMNALKYFGMIVMG